MLARLVESFYRKLVTPLDQRLIDLTFAVEPSQAAVDALLQEWDIEVAGAGKAGLLSYVLNAHPELDFGDYTAPRLKGLFMRNRFANLKLVAHFTKVGRRLNDLGLRPLVIKGGAMKFLRPELPRDMGDIDFLLPTRAEVERVCGLVRELGYQGEIGGSNHAATICAPDGAEVMDIHWTMDFMSSYDSDAFWTGVRARSRACKVFGVDALVPAAEDLLFIVLQNLAKNLRKQQTLKGAVFAAFDCAWLQARPGFDVARVLADVRETQTDFNAALAAQFVNRIVPDLLPALMTDALGASPRVQEQLNQAFFYSHRLVGLRRACRALRHNRPFANPVKAARFLAMEFRRLWLSIFNKRPRLLALHLALFPPREEELCA